MKLRTLMWLITLVAGLALGGLIIWRTTLSPRPPAQTAVLQTGQALIGGPFQLIDQESRPTTEALLQGHWTVVFFGFTACPDVCPTTLQALAQTEVQLGARAEQMRVVFISLDPERDTPAELRAYLSGPAMPTHVTGLTGSAEQVAAAARAYRVFYERVGTGSNYNINHSTAAYLMNPQGRFERVLAFGMTPQDMARQIRDAMG